MSTSQESFQPEPTEEYYDWCGDINDRAVNAITNEETNPVVSEMAQVIESSETERYPCETQEEQQASWGYAPVSNFSGTTGDNAPEESDDLVLGYGPIVPRWDVVKTPDRKLQYFVKADGFPDQSSARAAATEFQNAADAWNALQLGINIQQINDETAANFYLVYEENPASGPGRNTLARAFFPHEIDQDVIVFSKALTEQNISILKNVFQHEIGHVLGLRHEFAIKGDPSKRLKPEGEGAVLFMKENYNSIMSYNFPPRMQQSDREQTAAFYKLNNGYLIGTSPVTDFAPRVRSQA